MNNTIFIILVLTLHLPVLVMTFCESNYLAAAWVISATLWFFNTTIAHNRINELREANERLTGRLRETADRLNDYRKKEVSNEK